MSLKKFPVLVEKGAGYFAEDKERSVLLNLGKIDFCNCGRRINTATLEITLRYDHLDPSKITFTVRGTIWNGTKTDILTSGQCDNTFQNLAEANVFPPAVKSIVMALLPIWRKYHLHQATESIQNAFGKLWALPAAPDVAQTVLEVLEAVEVDPNLPNWWESKNFSE